MLTKNINNKILFKYNQMPQKKKMQLHKNIFLTLASSLLFTINYGNISCFATPVTLDQAQTFKKIIDDNKGNVNLDDIKDDDVGKIFKDSINDFTQIEDSKIIKIEDDRDRILRVVYILMPVVKKDTDVFNGFKDGEEASIVVESLLKMYNNDGTKAFNNIDEVKAFIRKGDGNDYDEKDSSKIANNGINAILKEAYHLVGEIVKYRQKIDGRVRNGEFYSLRNIGDIVRKDTLKLIESKKKIAEANDKNTELTQENEKLTQETNELKSKIEKLKANDPEKLDPNTQAEIKQKEEELNKVKEELNKVKDELRKVKEELNKVKDELRKVKEEPKKVKEELNKVEEEPKKNRPEVIKVQEKLQIAQAAIEAQTYAVQNIAAIQSSIVSNITDARMNINQCDISTSEDENKPVAAGSQTVDSYITPTSWDIWASGHMGNIRQDAADAISANSQTDFYGGSIGIDKIFANNSILGLALSYGQSTTEYKSQTSAGVTGNEKWESNYYQADVYIHHNFTDNLFIQLIGGIGTYGKDTTIGNIFDFSSQKSTFGYHGNATIGYSIFGGEDSNFAVTPKLGIAYYHLNIPDSILSKTDSSTFTTLGRLDGIAGLSIKILNLNNNSNSNVKITPEITAAFKYRFSDNVDGINSDNIKLPVAKSKSTNSNDLSANALATPEQLFTLGLALTVATNNNFSISLNISSDFATQYFAIVGGASLKLSF